MKNDLPALNSYLFEELERLNDDETLKKSDEFDKEIKRSKAIANIAKNIIDNANTELNAVKLATEYGKNVEVPKMLLGNKND